MATFNKYKKKGSNKDFWEYRIYYQDPITRKTKEKSKKGFTSKPEAKLAAEEMERLLREGFEQVPISLKEYLSYWLNDYLKGTIRDNTFDQKEQNIRLHILPYFKDIQLADIKPILYQKFINFLADKGLSKRTVEINHWIMHAAYERAIIEKKVKDNPCKGAAMKGKEKSAKDELKFIDSADVSGFLEEAYKYDYIYWLLFSNL